MAGTMASSSGNATVAPTPRRNVRRGSANFVITIEQPPYLRNRNWARITLIGAAVRQLHLERHARDHALDESSKPQVVARRVALDPPDGRCIARFEAAAQ